jgi:hypothetical protein
MFTVVKIYSDGKGESRFEEIQIPLKDGGNIGKLSEALPATSVIFREVEPAYDWDFHRAPQRQYIILIDGEIEIETSLGEKRTFKGGDIILAEDTTGKGHKSRNIKPIKRRYVFITF